MQFLDIHTHSAQQRDDIFAVQSLSLTADLAVPANVPIAVGLHPWYAKLDQFVLQYQKLEHVAGQINVKMIGECGLDKRKGEKLESQIEILVPQIKLAQKLGKPMILHCIKAFGELLALKQQLKVEVPMVIHGFNKNEALAKQLLDQGFYLSMGSAILNPNTGAAKTVLACDTFFLETDDSEIGIEVIYAAAANLKKCSVDELKARIFADWNKIIGI